MLSAKAALSAASTPSPSAACAIQRAGCSISLLGDSAAAARARAAMVYSALAASTTCTLKTFASAVEGKAGSRSRVQHRRRILMHRRDLQGLRPQRRRERCVRRGTPQGPWPGSGPRRPCHPRQRRHLLRPQRAVCFRPRHHCPRQQMHLLHPQRAMFFRRRRLCLQPARWIHLQSKPAQKTASCALSA